MKRLAHDWQLRFTSNQRHDWMDLGSKTSASTFAAFPNLVPPHSQWHPQLRLPASSTCSNRLKLKCVFVFCWYVQRGRLECQPSSLKARKPISPSTCVDTITKTLGWSHWQEFIQRIYSISTQIIYFSITTPSTNFYSICWHLWQAHLCYACDQGSILQWSWSVRL